MYKKGIQDILRKMSNSQAALSPFKKKKKMNYRHILPFPFVKMR